MGLLQAVIPEIPEERSRIVPARLARKIGPLFGVPWPEGPFGDVSWVSDYSRLTLSEIARGAPGAARAQAGRLPLPPDGWRLDERVGVVSPGAALPNEIANATLNRFGPDTKAAVVLTGVNRLLEPVREALAGACELLVDERGAPLPPASRLAGWLSVVIEVFRSQPALVAAGIRARSIQRQLCTTWELPLSPTSTVPLTRSEISAPTGGRASSQPFELEFVDSGLYTLLGTDPDDGGHVADMLLSRLLDVGTLRDSSHLWLAERAPGSLAVEALLPPTELIGRLSRRILRSRGDGPAPPVLPAVPDESTFAALPLLTRRSAVIGLIGVLRQAQFDPVTRERTRACVLERLDRLASALDAGLPAEDPVGVVARCRIAVMRVHTRRHDRTSDLGDDVRALLHAADRCAGLGRRGVLDRGAAAEILTAAHIEVNALRWTNAADPGARLPDPDDLDRWLRHGWATCLDLLDVPAAVRTGEQSAVPGLLGFHLHNYAAFLASHTDSSEDLHTAIRLLQTVVLPAREAFHDRTGSSEPSRHSLQIGSRATTALSELAARGGDDESARRWASLGLGWIRRALADMRTEELLASAPTEIACRFALHAVPALLTAAELGVGNDDDIRTAGQLVATARRWEDTLPVPDRHARHRELTDLTRRLERLRGGASRPDHPISAG